MTRVAVCGGDELRAAAATLGLADAGGQTPEIVLLDLRDPAAVAAAAAIPGGVPRVVVCEEARDELLRALGLTPASVARSCDAASIGPLIADALPHPARRATRLVALTAARGGVGRTLLAVNVAVRLARRMPVWLIDATGTGTAAWWLRASPRPWSELEGLAGELAPEHLRVVATEAARDLRIVGGAPVAPTTALLVAAATAALALGELVLVDAPLLADERTRRLAELADRLVVVTYEDPASAAALASAELDGAAWVVASQSAAATVAGRETLAALPRDERAVAAAIAGPSPVGGALGRAYDHLAELMALDAS